MTKEFLTEYLEHISYEIEGLVSSYMQMSEISDRSKTHPFELQGQKNDCLDLMALHFRNLYEFFCFAPKENYVRATDYIIDFKGNSDSYLINKANNQTSHFTKQRHELAKEHASKSWDPNSVMKWFVVNFDKFIDGLTENYKLELSKRLVLVVPFIEWHKKEHEKN